MQKTLAWLASAVILTFSVAATAEPANPINRSGGVDASGANLDGNLQGFSSRTFEELATLNVPDLSEIESQITNLQNDVSNNTQAINNNVTSMQQLADRVTVNSNNISSNTSAAAAAQKDADRAYSLADAAYRRAGSAMSKASSAYTLASAPVRWSDMPSGTQCGLSWMTGSRTRANDTCLGHHPRSSCPRGFTRRDLGYFEAGGGTRYMMTCVKD